MELIQEFKNYLLSQKKQPSKATVKNYVADVKKFISWVEAKLNHPFLPQTITKELIQDYKTHQVSVFSASSLDRQISSLKKFFEFLKLEGRIGTNPFESVTIKQTTQDPWHLKEFKDFLYVYNASHLTIKNYLIDVKQFFAWAEKVTSAESENKLPDRNILSKLNDKMIEEYSQRLLHEGNFSPASINRKLSSLRKYLIWAHDQELLSPAVTTLPANTSLSLPNEADLDEENANSRIDIEALGATSTLAPEIENEAKLTAPQFVKNEEVEAVKTYSKIPPVRLFQKLGSLLSIALEYAVVIPLAHIAAHVKHRIWVLKGKPVFTRTDVKLPEKLQPFKSHVKNLSKSFYNPWGISIAHFPIHKKVLYHIQYTRPAWYRRYSRLPAARYFNLAILMVFCAMIGFGLYSSFFSNARKNQTLAALPTAPPRVLSFQGRLTDNNDNPITTANTHLRFAIYNDASASGSALLWQEVDTVSPDTDGDFSTMLGNVTTIPQNLFAQYNALWLGVTVETTPELAPRQQIATVAFATNAETLQGLPPITQSGAGTQNVVLALDSSGNLGVAASTTFQSTTGTFTLSGNTTLLTTNSGSNGNITLAPDGYGTIDLQKPLQNSTLNNNIPSAAGSVEVDDLLSVLATSSGQSAFTINQNSTGPLISASTSGVAKFTVDSLGNVTAAGNITGSTIYAGGGTSYYINNGISNLNSLTLASNLSVSGNVASDLIPALPTDTYSLGDASHEWNNLYVKNLVVNGSAFAQYWQLNNSVLAPGVTTNDLAVGGNSTSSAKFLIFGTSAGAQPAGTASTSGNFTFNGATNPAKINLINGTSLGFYTASSGKGDAGLSSSPTLYVANGGTVGIGNNSPSYSLDVTGNLRVTTAGGFGGSVPGTVVQGQVSSLAVTGYTGLGGLRINGANTTDTIYNGQNNIVISRDAGGFIGLTQTSTPTVGLLVNTYTGGVGINTGTTGIGNGQLVVNQSNISGLGDIIAASAAGSTVFTVANNGDVTGSQFIDKQNSSYFLDPAATGTSLAVAGGIGVGGATPSTFKVQVAGDVGPDANNTYDLGSYSSNLQWRNIYGEHIFSNGTELSQFWQRNLGALSPLFITDDLLLGGTSTASAKFAFMNVSGNGVPTASISAGTVSNTYLTADGTLATTALQALTLGSSTTGDINIGTSAVSKNITVGGTGQTGNITIGQSTASNTINIGNTNTTSGNIQTINIGAGSPTGTGKTNITIGNTNDSSSLKLVAGNGNISLTGATATNYSIGDSFSTGSLTLGQSTAGQAINIGNAINTVGQVIQIANGNSAGNSDVDILSGNGTAGIGTLHLGDNTRVNNITLGNVAPAGARTITIAGGNAAQNDTVSILNGAPSAGTQTVSILSGTATGGTQILNLGSATSTTTIKGSNFVSGSVAYTTSNTLQFTGVGSAGQCLLSNASSAPSWGLCTYGNGNYWNVQQGTLFPINATLDFLIGADAGATSSAKFAVTNIAGTTPYASVSAVTSGGGTGTGILLGGDGSIQSLVNGTLTIGGNTTGNIVLKPLNGLFGGSVTLSGYSTGIIHSTSGLLTASAVDLASADVTGILPKANGGTGQSTYTNGDMLYYDSGTSTTALTKLSIGADNSILNVDSSTHLPKWTSSPTLSGLTVTGTSTLSTLASSVAGGSGTVLNPTTNGTLDLGDSTHYFGTIYATNLITPVGNGTQGFWQLTNNVISPVNSFYDLAVGGSSTSSATPWQVFGTSVDYNTAGTATSSGNLTFRGATTAISQLNGYDLNFKVSPGGDEGLTTVLTLGGNKNVTVANDLAVNGSNLTSSASTFNLFNTTVNTLNLAGVAANINVGRGSTTTTLNGNLVLNTPASSNTITIYGNFISSLVPNADNTYDLGANGLSWRNAYLNNVFGDAVTGTQGYWTVNTNVLSPTFNWQDLAVGGTATGSATPFQVFASSYSIPSYGTVPAGTASTSGNLVFRGGATNVNLLNNTTLSFNNSVGGNTGINLSTPELFLNNNGRIGIGTNNPGTTLDVYGGIYALNTAIKIAYNSTYNKNGINFYGDGVVSTSNNGNLNLMTNGTGAIGIETLSPLATLDVRGNSGTTPVASFSGQTSNAALIANNDGIGDIFSASASGTPEFTIASDGTIKNNIIPNTTDTYNLGSDPTLPGGKEWDTLYVRQVVTPTGNLGSNYWQLSNQGTLAPISSTYDLVVGGNSTASAKFQVFAGSYLNNPAGTASTSGNLIFGGSNTPTKINLLGGSDLGIYTSVGGDSGLNTNPLLYLSNNSNYVGIGTSTPQGILDVNSTGANPTLPSDLTLTQTSGTNLIPNPSFENNSITGWTLQDFGTSGSITATPAASLYGAYSLVVQKGTSSTDAYQTITVSPSTTYTFSAWVKTTNNGSQLDVWDSGTLVDHTSGAVTGDGQWHRISVTITTGSSTTSVQAKADVYAGSTGVLTYYDGFQLEQTSSATPYMDGSLGPGYYWTGKPNNSSSVRTLGANFAYQTINSASGIGAASRSQYPVLQLDQDGSGDVIAASVSGVNKFVLTNAGNVGIGVSAPQTGLEVASPSAYTEAVGSPNNPAILIKNTSSSNFNEKAELQFAVGNNNAPNAVISAYYTDWKSPGSGSGLTGADLAFSTKTAAGSLTEAMRIKNNGSIGIGTSTPLSQSALSVQRDSLGNALVALKQLGSTGDLLVASNSAGTLEFKFDNSGTLTANSFYDIQNTSYFLDPAATGTSLDVAGSVMIGTTSATTSKLTVAGSATTNSGNIELADTANNTGSRNWLIANGYTAYGNLEFISGNAAGSDPETTGTSIMTLTNAGNVGIGTTNPNTLLQVGSGNYIKSSVYSTDSAYGQLQIGNPTSGAEASIGFIMGVTAFGDSPTSANGNTGVWTEGVGSFSVGTGNFGLGNASHGNVMTWLSGGNVGIGTTGPDETLQVNGLAHIGTNQGSMTAPTTSNTNLVLYNFGSSNWSGIGSDGGGAMYFAAGTGGVSSRMVITPSGDVGIGTTTTYNTVGGSGISFPNTGSPLTWGSGPYSAIYDNAQLHIWTDDNMYFDVGGTAASPTNRMYINSSGQVGINTTSPGTHKLAVSDNLNGKVVSFANFTTTNSTSVGVLELRLGATGTGSRFIQFYSGATSHGNGTGQGSVIFTTGGVAYNTLVADFGEWFDVVDNSNYGDLMASYPDGNRRATATESGSLIGVVSDSSGFVGNASSDDPNHPNPNHNPALATQIIGLTGQIRTHVSTINGPIHTGDYIAVSPIVGYGQKATTAGQIIGRAVVDFDPANGKGTASPCPDGTPSGVYCGRSLVYVNVGYYDPDRQLADDSSFQLLVQQLNNQNSYSLQNQFGQIVTKIGGFSQLVAAQFRAGSIQTQELLTNSLAIATDNVSIAGQSLHDYIVSVVNQVLQNTSGTGTTSPIADFDQIHTNLVSPLASTSAVAIDLQNSKVSVKNTSTGDTVASIDNSGNATFSGTLTGQNLAINGDATISGTLHADKIEANSIAGLQEVVGTLSAQNITNVTNIYFATPSGTPSGENFATGSGSTSNNSNSLLTQSGGFADIASFSAYLSYVPNLHATTGMFDQGLVSLGPTSLTDTSIAGTLTVGSQLMIADTSINVLGGDLQIQPLRQGGIAFAGGLVHIDADGNLNVNGKAVFNSGIYATTISPLAGQDLSIQLGDTTSSTSANPSPQLTVKNASGSGVFAINQLGDIVASGAANISKLNFNFVQPAMALSDIEVVATGSAGTAQIKQYQTQVTIDDPNVTANSLIYITPVGTTDIPYLMRQVTGKSFTVGISGITNHTVPFNWLIVN